MSLIAGQSVGPSLSLWGPSEHTYLALSCSVGPPLDLEAMALDGPWALVGFTEPSA